MPTYVYECAKCGDEFEQWQSFSDDPLKKHPGCGGKVTKVVQPVGIVFKGSGFHKTDSRNGSKRSRGAAVDKDTDSSSASDSSSDTKKADAPAASDSKKPDTKKSDPKKSEKAASSASSG
ncbi:MAG TPA: FmdB family zinc ribbon protein [Acidimicrobiia bacterium]